MCIFAENQLATGRKDGPMEFALIFLIFLLVWVAFGVIGAMIMANKGRSGVGGFLLGICLGIIGLIMALVMRPSLDHEVERRREIERRMGKLE